MIARLIMKSFLEFECFLERLSPVFSVNMKQSLVVKILKKRLDLILFLPKLFVSNLLNFERKYNYLFIIFLKINLLLCSHSILHASCCFN